MWKEDDVTTQRSITTPQGASVEPTVSDVPSQHLTGTATVVPTVVIIGEVTAHEDLTIEGRVEGTIESNLHSVTISQTGLVKAEILAKDIVVIGKMIGSVNASEKVKICPNGSVQGDVVSPTVTIAEGATFRGSIDTPRKPAEEPGRVAEQSAAAAGITRSEETPRRLLDTEIPVAEAGPVPQSPNEIPQKKSSHAA